MTKHSPLNTLIELAVNDADEAAKRLGMAIRNAEATEQKLCLLIGYRDDYAMRFQANQAAGITPMGYRNFQAFLDKLDNAISGQREIISHANKMVVAERTAWQACERKRLSYDTLASRAQKEEQHRETKRDQKMTDEFATRQASHKREH